MDLELYAVAYGSPVCIAYYWAEDTDHAHEQASQDGTVLAIRKVPGDYECDNEGQVVIYTGRYEENYVCLANPR